jgi:hypothetical protein
MLFRGDHTRQPKVALGGRGSGSSENREEALERIRRERQKRRQQKAEHASALLIQATWRRMLSQKLAKSLIRAQWMDKYGEDGSRWPVPAGGASVYSSANPMLREVLYFLDPGDMRDVELLARVCLYLSNNARAFATAAIVQPHHQSPLSARIYVCSTTAGTSACPI